jgi:7-cyano-7-deazaguanine synthase in queuosine biosynthesis
MNASVGSSEAKESSTRSRSLVFLALGVYAAQRIGPGVPVYAPENGFIALNVPLTPSRSGSCSTRTMHPYFLESFRDVLKGLGIENQVVNPFELMTKGECFEKCGNLLLLDKIVDHSVSCSSAGRDKKRKNCGYCVPCIIRRAALHRIGRGPADGKKYRKDICKLKNVGKLGPANDLRAVLDFLRHKHSDVAVAKLITAVSCVSKPTLNNCVQVVQRGCEEVRKWLKNEAKRDLTDHI